MTSIGDRVVELCNFGFGSIETVSRLFRRSKVETISTGELQALLAERDSPVVLIDVRSRSEQAVSKIPGAVTLQEYESGDGSYLNQSVVVYCTMGGRSYLYARKLVTAGIDAKNYRDGILGSELLI